MHTGTPASYTVCQTARPAAIATGTSVWVFREEICKKWEVAGSLLWIHGKAGSGKSILWFGVFLSLYVRKLI
ncbi:hypothetical protein V8E53_014398 [Lactarius tabidus]